MPHVLIFEDDQLLQPMYQQKFSRAKFVVTVKSDATDAVAVAEKVKPDIILMDLIMPKVDGFDATRALMSDRRTSAIPVLIVSNLSDPATIQKALWYGAKDIVVKADLTPEQLVQKTRDVLAGKPSEHVLNPQLIEVLHIDAQGRPQTTS
ncbi:MAG: response regulator [Patescibacteria group bacterium]|jgi:PleD family two-component response regulator